MKRCRLADLPERFRSKVRVESNGCWVWTASLSNGYGQYMLVTGKPVRAHRWAYEQFIGPVPKGLELDHLCRVPSCINPSHLEPVTHAENMRRGNAGKHQRAKTHCLHGHAYTGDNVLWHLRGKCWARDCRTCSREKDAARRARQPKYRACGRWEPSGLTAPDVQFIRDTRGVFTSVELSRVFRISDMHVRSIRCGHRGNDV